VLLLALQHLIVDVARLSQARRKAAALVSVGVQAKLIRSHTPNYTQLGTRHQTDVRLCAVQDGCAISLCGARAIHLPRCCRQSSDAFLIGGGKRPQPSRRFAVRCIGSLLSKTRIVGMVALRSTPAACNA
jgi:hypothetical protein